MNSERFGRVCMFKTCKNIFEIW